MLQMVSISDKCYSFYSLKNRECFMVFTKLFISTNVFNI